MPQMVWGTSGRGPARDGTRRGAGGEYSVTFACHASAPLKAERLFQTWMIVQIVSGANARSEASLLRTYGSERPSPAGAVVASIAERGVGPPGTRRQVPRA